MFILPRPSLLFALLAMSAATAFTSPAPFIIPLWPHGAPGAIACPTYHQSVIYRDNDPARPRITQVTTPSLEAFLPDPSTATGAAVVICPGGGYVVLAYDLEGTVPARWFASHGVAAFVLKYRLPSDKIMRDKRIGPLQDVEEAIRTVRRRAAEWHVNPSRVGVMGFSAGGNVAATASTLYRDNVYTPEDHTDDRPDFTVLVYGVISMEPGITHPGSQHALLGAHPTQADCDRFSAELHVDAHTPPAFLVQAADDPAVPIQNSLRYYEAMLRHHVPGELHIYEKGGHGFGFDSPNISTRTWPEALRAWLQSRELMR